MKLLAILLSLAGALMVIISGFMALFSPMVMDAPGSEKSGSNWLFIYMMFASPLAFLVTDILAWVQIGHGNYSAAIKWVFVGFIPFIVAIFALFSIGR